MVAEKQTKKVCQGVGLEMTDPDHPWTDLDKAYLYFVDGAPKASGKFMIEVLAGSFSVKSKDCVGIGLKWQHGIQCCEPCHQVSTESNNVAKNCILLIRKLVYCVSILGRSHLSKSDTSYLQYAIVERPSSTGNDACTRFKEAAKVRMQLETSAQKLPSKLKGTSEETVFRLVLDIYGQGRRQEMECQWSVLSVSASPPPLADSLGRLR